MGKEKSETENVFDFNQKHLLVFQTFCLLKNTKESSGKTQKTNLKLQVFVFFSLLAQALAGSITILNSFT